MADDIYSAVHDGIASAFPSACHDFSCGAATGTCVEPSSDDVGTDPVTATGPAEQRRVVLPASVFPSLSKGSPVHLDDEPRIVTSLRVNRAADIATVGLSASLSSSVVTFSGSRSSGDFSFEVSALWVPTTPPAEPTDSYAASRDDAFLILVRSADWPADSSPRVGDDASLVGLDGADISLRVKSVESRDGYHLLTCLTDGGES